MGPDELNAEARYWIRAGFEDVQRIVEIIYEERYEPGTFDKASIRQALEREAASLVREQQSWPSVTDCDKLDNVFSALKAQNIIALQNAGNTQSDGYGDAMEVAQSAPNRNQLVGYCYYHGQDLERAVKGDGLYLSFGPLRPDEEKTEGPKIGQIIVTELNRQGLRTIWKGTFADRILVKPIDWKRRRK